MEEGNFASPAPIEAKWEASITTSITIKDMRGKLEQMMRSGNFAGKTMHVESRLIPMQTSYGGNPQMIRVGVELEGVDPALTPFEDVVVRRDLWRIITARRSSVTRLDLLLLNSDGHMIHFELKTAWFARHSFSQFQFNRVIIGNLLCYRNT